MTVILFPCIRSLFNDSAYANKLHILSDYLRIFGKTRDSGGVEKVLTCAVEIAAQFCKPVAMTLNAVLVKA